MIQDGMVAWCDESQKLWLVSKKGADGTIEYWRLPTSEKKSFDAARWKEIDTLLNMGAYRLLSLEESLKFREKIPRIRTSIKIRGQMEGNRRQVSSGEKSTSYFGIQRPDGFAT